MSKEKQNNNCPGYYNVSGYTTKDGKHVNDYTRQCWKHGNENNQNDKEKVNSDTMEKIDDLAQIISFVLKNRHKKNNIPEQNYNPQQFPYITQNENPLQPQPFSTFNLKSTKEKIKDSTKEIENILKQPKISDDEVEKIKDKTNLIAKAIINDIEKITKEKTKLPQIPTMESVNKGQEIEKQRKEIREDASNAIITLNLAKNVLDKNWKNVHTNDLNYEKKLDDYLKNKTTLEKISNALVKLFYSIGEIDKNTEEKVKEVKKEIEMPTSEPKEEKPVDQKQEWIWPVGSKNITSPYGWRIHPITKIKTFHTGIDIKVKAGTPVRAIANGKVFAARSGMTGYGTGVFIDHGKVDGKYVRSEYGHLSRYCVKYGQYVKQGEIIGYSGNTGDSTGDHLHLTIRISLDNIHFEHNDPLKYLPKY